MNGPRLDVHYGDARRTAAKGKGPYQTRGPFDVSLCRDSGSFELRRRQQSPNDALGSGIVRDDPKR
jgi:hypothetical protein